MVFVDDENAGRENIGTLRADARLRATRCGVHAQETACKLGKRFAREHDTVDVFAIAIGDDRCSVEHRAADGEHLVRSWKIAKRRKTFACIGASLPFQCLGIIR